MINIPYEPILFNVKVNIHLIAEYLAFIVAFRYYVILRKNQTDAISKTNRLSIIIGATVGALIGSRLFAFCENPLSYSTPEQWLNLLNNKTIMGGLFGGLLGVEISKKIIGEKQSSGDLFTLPIILGIFIGRIGCFLSGIKESTYGIPTNSWLGMDLGDGVLRHPTSLYELFFLIALFIVCFLLLKRKLLKNGNVFILFMLSYFGFRFLIEFIKPNYFFILGLSSIQWLSILCYLYYFAYFYKLKHNAR